MKCYWRTFQLISILNETKITNTTRVIYQTESQGQKLSSAPFQKMTPLRSEVYVWASFHHCSILPVARQWAPQALRRARFTHCQLCRRASVSPQQWRGWPCSVAQAGHGCLFFKQCEKATAAVSLTGDKCIQNGGLLRTSRQTLSPVDSNALQGPDTLVKPPGVRATCNSARSPHSGRLWPKG